MSANETIYTVVVLNDGRLNDAFPWRGSDVYSELEAEWDNDESEPFPYTEAEFYAKMTEAQRLEIDGSNITIVVIEATEPEVKSLQGLFTNQLTNEVTK